MRQRFAAVVLAVTACGCSGGSDGTPKVPVATIPTPKWALAACASVAELRRFCPGRVPLTSRRGWSMIFTPPRARFAVALFQLQSGVAVGGNDEHVHRPPIFGNTVVLGGRFMQLNRRAFPPSDATPVVLRNGIANGLRRRPIALGPRTWSGIRGELSLTPTVYAGLGELSDLVVFEWHDAAGEHAVGVNVWEPLIDSVATLRAIVATLAPQSPSAPPRTVAVVDGVAMIASPPWLDRLCRTPRILRGACPSRVPAVGSQGASVEIVPTPPSAPPTLKSLFVSVSWGGEYPDPRLNQPPGFVHLDLTAGHVVRSRRFAPLLPLARVTAPTGYEAKRPISLGDAYGPRIRARLSSATASGTTSATAGRQTGVITRSTSTPGCRLDRPRTR